MLRHQAGSLAVGVADPATGAATTYHGGQRFDTASIVKADILAVLLLQHQQLGTWLTPHDQDLAAAMIDDSDNAAATALWTLPKARPGSWPATRCWACTPPCPPGTAPGGG